MFTALRRETIKFGRDFVYQLVAGVEVWKGCSGKFKTTSVLLAVYLTLIVFAEISWKIVNGHSTPGSAGVVLWMISMQIAKLIGKRHSWF